MYMLMTWLLFGIFNMFVFGPVLCKVYKLKTDNQLFFIGFLGGYFATFFILVLIAWHPFGKLFKNVRVKFPEILSPCELINKIWRLK